MRARFNELPALNFEQVFAIDPAHQLVLVRSRSRGGALVGQLWTHNEYAPGGRLVARYETYEELNPLTGTRRGGWSKYDQEGRLLATGDTTHSPRLW
jgi:hypothetical protein